MRNPVLLVSVCLAVLVAGCAASAVTVEQAKAAPARLQADTGPDGQLSGSTTTMDIAMAMDRGDASMSLEMAMAITQEFHAGGAVSVTVRFTRFHMGAESSSGMPDFSKVVLHIFCAPDRWVLSTEGMAAAGMEDSSLETANTRGTCVGKDSSADDDLGRLLASMASEIALVSSSILGGFQIPAYEFVALDGNTATYRVGPAKMGMPAINVTATFDGEARIEGTTLTMSMPDFGMTMDAVAEYSYGTRSQAPNTHGERKL